MPLSDIAAKPAADVNGRGRSLYELIDCPYNCKKIKCPHKKNNIKDSYMQKVSYFCRVIFLKVSHSREYNKGRLFFMSPVIKIHSSNGYFIFVIFFMLAASRVDARNAATGLLGEHTAMAGHGTVDVVILGDSNTSIGGDGCDNPKGWNKWFRDKFAPKTCRSYARSGATWTNTCATVYDTQENTGKLSNNNVIYNQINRLRAACGKGTQPVPELILIAAGTNDAWFSEARPGAFDKTATQVFAENSGRFITDKSVCNVVTLAESVRYGCEMLMESFPDAQIILLTPLQSVQAGMAEIRKVGDIIEDCGHYMSINVIRQDYGSGVYSVREKASGKFTYDGTHTSEEGARCCGYYIANMVSAVLHIL